MATKIPRVSPIVDKLAAAHNALQRATIASGTTGAPSAAGTAAHPTHTHTATCSLQTISGHVNYDNVAVAETAAGTATLVTDVGIADGALVVAAQPDVPRKLNVIITDADSSVSAGTVALVGVGARGQALSQVINLKAAVGANSRTVVTTDAYATLTSATVAASAGVGAGDNIAIGQATALGLPGMQVPAPTAASYAVFKACVAGAPETVGTVDSTAGTIIPTTLPDGSRDYDFWWTHTFTPTLTGATSAPSATVAIPTSAHTHTITAVAAIHHDVSELTVTHAASTNAATAYTLLTQLRSIYEGDADMGDVFPGHRADTLAHTIADDVNVMTVARNSATLATAYLEANELKAVYNAHMAQAGVHRNDDTTNTVTAPDANSEGSLVTLCNDIRVQLLAHLADGMAGAALRVVSP